LLIVSDHICNFVAENLQMDSTQVVQVTQAGLVTVAPKLGNGKCSQAEGLLQQAMLRKMRMQNVLYDIL